ncbi:Bowman-Birk type proteinase inhibitor-like [Prosopis cineraria]|uniref:Bowman-Birk type proteinase inhibitor-like n=1 Tax=Prosopis cineraria TaxID=364024 RepID=UPI00241037CE|nr:Bowman-Birk type proteinase inhibitor-like [Prosopis cineraria]
MSLNQKMIVKVAVVLFLMAFTATTEARLNPSTLLASALMNGEQNFITKSTTTACCDNCVCTKSEPPQCQCRDIGETCHSACNFCLCALSYPPQCRCLDTTNFCYPSCSSTAKTAN